MSGDLLRPEDAAAIRKAWDVIGETLREMDADDNAYYLAACERLIDGQRSVILGAVARSLRLPNAGQRGPAARSV